jgi:hypothetical protein
MVIAMNKMKVKKPVRKSTYADHLRKEIQERKEGEHGLAAILAKLNPFTFANAHR